MARNQDDERGMVVNSASDPQRPGEPVARPKADSAAPGTSAHETSVPTTPAGARGEPGPPRPPEDRGGDDPGRGGVE